jgi:hypothetical protein
LTFVSLTGIARARADFGLRTGYKLCIHYGAQSVLFKKGLLSESKTDFLFSPLNLVEGFAADSAHPKFKSLQQLVMQSAPDTGLLTPIPEVTGLH